MKSLLIASILALTSSAFAAEVLETCKVGEGMVVTITKEAGKTMFTMTGASKQPVAATHNLSAVEARNDEMIAEIASYINVDMAKVTHVKAYELLQDDDGGFSLIAYYAKKKLIKSTVLSMAGPMVCL
jgi:hypothetical protein